MVRPIGGGKLKAVYPVAAHGRKLKLVARMPIFGRDDLGVVVGPAAYAGKIIVPHWEELARLLKPGQSRFDFRFRPEHLIWQLVTDVHHTLRQVGHILANYGYDPLEGEKAAMLKAAKAAERLNLAVLELEPGASIAKMREQTSAALAEAAQVLGKNPRKLSKLEAQEQITRLQSGTDSRGRVNPSVAMTRSRIAFERVTERLGEIMTIDPHIAGREKAIRNMIHWVELILHDLVNKHLTSLLVRDGLRPALNPRIRLRMAAHLEYLAQRLEGIDFNPYRLAALETITDLREARNLLRENAVDSYGLRLIRRLLIKCRSAIAIKRVQIEVERLIFNLTRSLELEKRAPVLSTSASIISLTKRLDYVLFQIAGIDELGFRRPVCQTGIELLRESNDILGLYLREPQRVHLEEARNRLKAASASL